jgi:hypothetical protein
MKHIKVNNSIYSTNIEDLRLIKKCIDFFSDGCVSYAISFFNEPESVITKMKIDKMECYVLKGFNFNYRFVPVEYEKINTVEDLASKFLNLIELI